MTNFQQILLKLNDNLNLLREREARYAGNAPLDLLNQATDLLFLQRLGGSYRFIHRSVQEHFAAKWMEETGGKQ